MYLVLHAKYPLFLSDLNELEFSWQIFEKIQKSSFMKIRPTGSALYYVDRVTDGDRERERDTTKLTVALRNFAD